MIYSTIVTSKGTVTIAAPLRKALGIKSGQRLSLSLSKEGNIIMNPGTTMAGFEATRAAIVSKIPAELRNLNPQRVAQAQDEARLRDYEND